MRGALSIPHIQPVAADDPQPNPPDKPDEIIFYATKQTPEAEVEKIATSVKRWCKDNPDKTVACLVPTNRHGAKLVEVFKARGVPFIELLQSTDPTRAAADLIAKALQVLAEPVSVQGTGSSSTRPGASTSPNPKMIPSGCSEIRCRPAHAVCALSKIT